MYKIKYVKYLLYIYIYFSCLSMPSDFGLDNRLNVFHELHVLDKVSKDEVCQDVLSV